MKKWGAVITLFYGIVVVALSGPVAALLFVNTELADLKKFYASSIPWICAVLVMLGAALLLFLSVDTTQKRLMPRTHILISTLTVGLFMGILTVAIGLAIGFAIRGDRFLPDDLSVLEVVAIFVIPWCVWGIVFYRLCRNSADPISRGMSWMLRGSVLELLIAVPAHVIMRRRNDCSAPVINSFGIASGIAIMLLSFGPSVLLLYKKRMDGYAPKQPAEN